MTKQSFRRVRNPAPRPSAFACSGRSPIGRTPIAVGAVADRESSKVILHAFSFASSSSRLASRLSFQFPIRNFLLSRFPFSALSLGVLVVDALSAFRIPNCFSLSSLSLGVLGVLVVNPPFRIFLFSPLRSHTGQAFGLYSRQEARMIICNASWSLRVPPVALSGGALTKPVAGLPPWAMAELR